MLLDDAPLHRGPEQEGDSPLPLRPALEVGEAALREPEPGPLGLDGHERVTRVKDPAVHDLGDGLSGRVPERFPEIGGLGIGEAVAVQIEAHPGAEDVRAQVLLEHAEHGRALLVGEQVEHGLAVARRAHLELDGPRVLEAVHSHGRRAGDAEGDPALPLGFPRVHGEQLHEGRERLVEPDAVPPRHGDEVAEPHVRHLVGDHVGDALQLRVRRGGLVDEEGGLAERDGAQVFHGAGGEVGNGEEIQLVAGVRQAVVALEELQRERAGGDAEARQRLLAGHAPDAERRLAHHDGVGGLQLAHDERHEVRGHADGVGEAHRLFARTRWTLGRDRGVRHRGEALGHHQGDAEDGLEGGLVPAREPAPGIRGLELGGGDGVRHPGRVLVRAPVEPVQPVVEHPREGEPQPPLAGRDRRREQEPSALGLCLQRHAALQRDPVGALDGDRLDEELHRVQDHLGHGFRHGDRDGFLPGEGRGVEVGFEPDVVAGGDDGRRESVFHHLTSRGRACGVRPRRSIILARIPPRLRGHT